jgi:hypothetical protein
MSRQLNSPVLVMTCCSVPSSRLIHSCSSSATHLRYSTPAGWAHNPGVSTTTVPLGLRRRRVDVLVAPPPVRGRRLEHVPAGKGRPAIVRARAGLDRGLAVGHAQHSPGPVPLAAPLVVDIGEVGTRGAGRPEKVLLIVVPRWWEQPALGRGRGRLDGVGAEKRRDGDCSGRDHGCGQQAGQNAIRGWRINTPVDQMPVGSRRLGPGALIPQRCTAHEL